MSKHVSFLCFIHLPLLHTSMPLELGSAEPSTNTFLVALSAHNLLVALPASPTHILFWFAHIFTISPVYLLFWAVCICLWICLYMFLSQVSYLPIPVCSYRLSWATMDCHPKRIALLSWRTESNPSPYSFASTHSCFFHSSPQNPHSTQFRLHPPVTSNEVRKHLHTPTLRLKLTLRLKCQPHQRLPVHRPFKSLLPPTLLPTRQSISASITWTTSSFQANL